MIKYFLDEFKSLPKNYVCIYLVVYLSAGFFMNQVGIWLGIAKFTYWWQVLTCYGLYMIPISIMLRKMNFKQQYLHGILAMGLLEFAGYAIGSSKAIGITELNNTIIIKNNILVEIINIKNFSLGMTLFFAIYFPLGNTLVEAIHKKLTKKEATP